MNSNARLAAAILVLALASSAAADAPSDVAGFMKTRHHHFHEIGAAFKGVLDQFKSPQPQVSELQKYTAVIDAMAPQIPTWFPVGTGPETGIKTQALASIWQKPAEFKNDAAEFAAQAHALNLAAKSGNLEAVRAAIEPTGEACKTCHQSFRAKDEH